MTARQRFFTDSLPARRIVARWEDVFFVELWYNE